MEQFLILLNPSRPTFPADATEAESAVIGEHFNYLKRALEAGVVILVGRTMDEHSLGLCVFEAEDMVAARKFLNEDPAVKSGIFVGEVRPYRVALMR